MSGATAVEPQWAPLVDVGQTSIREMLDDGGGDTALSRSVRRLVRSLDDPNGTISAFGSFES